MSQTGTCRLHRTLVIWPTPSCCGFVVKGHLSHTFLSLLCFFFLSPEMTQWCSLSESLALWGLPAAHESDITFVMASCWNVKWWRRLEAHVVCVYCIPLKQMTSMTAMEEAGRGQSHSPLFHTCVSFTSLSVHFVVGSRVSFVEFLHGYLCHEQLESVTKPFLFLWVVDR